MLLVAAVVAHKEAVEVGEHPERFGNTALVGDAHPHLAPALPRIGEIELKAFRVSATNEATSLVMALRRPMYLTWLSRIYLPV